MKIFLTGATGFVGANLLSDACSAQHQFICPVRTLPLAALKHTRYVQAASLDTAHTELAGCDAVIHLAGRAHVLREQAVDPETEFRKTNVEMTQALAQSALQAGVKRFIYVSSVKVNGDLSQGHGFTARDLPAPQDAYGRSKWEAEQRLLRLIGGAMEIVIVRPPLIYGPGVKANFARLLSCVQRGLPLPFGAIDNRRSLVYVGNLAHFLMHCISHPQAANRTWMVSDNQDMSTPQLIQALARAMHKPARLLHVSPSLLHIAARIIGKPDASVKLLGSLQVDISQTITDLQWTPPHSVENGLHATVQAVTAR